MQKTIDLRKQKKDEPATTKAEMLPNTEIKREDNNQTGPDVDDGIKWHGPLHISRPNKKLVLTVFAGLLAAAVLIVVLSGDFVTSVFLALLGIMIQVQSGKKGIDGEIRISHHGLHLNERLYPMNTIKSFWVDYLPGGTQELSVQLTKWHMPYIKIPIYGQNPLPIRDLLIQFVPEEEHQYTFVDFVRERLGL